MCRKFAERSGSESLICGAYRMFPSSVRAAGTTEIWVKSGETKLEDKGLISLCFAYKQTDVLVTFKVLLSNSSLEGLHCLLSFLVQSLFLTVFIVCLLSLLVCFDEASELWPVNHWNIKNSSQLKAWSRVMQTHSSWICAKNITFWHKIVFLIQHADSQRADNVTYLSVVWSVYLEV